MPESATDLSPEKLVIALKHDEEPFNISDLAEKDKWRVGVVPPDLFGFFSTRPVALRS